MVSPNYREEAERIVAEEKAQGEKLPIYEVSGRSTAPMPPTDALVGPGRLQTRREDGRWCILKCLQSDRAEDEPHVCCQGRPQIRVELFAGEICSLTLFFQICIVSLYLLRIPPHCLPCAGHAWEPGSGVYIYYIPNPLFGYICPFISYQHFSSEPDLTWRIPP